MLDIRGGVEGGETMASMLGDLFGTPVPPVAGQGKGRVFSP